MVLEPQNIEQGMSNVADVGRWALDVGRWALGVGRWTLGVGRWAPISATILFAQMNSISLAA